MRIIGILLLAMVAVSCNPSRGKNNFKGGTDQITIPEETSLIVLGTVQDGGSPHIGCKKDCCRELFRNPDKNRKVVSLGIVDPQNKKTYQFEATPDLPVQMRNLLSY